jgi:hypothetical protein
LRHLMCLKYSPLARLIASPIFWVMKYHSRCFALAACRRRLKVIGLNLSLNFREGYSFHTVIFFYKKYVHGPVSPTFAGGTICNACSDFAHMVVGSTGDP